MWVLGLTGVVLLILPNIVMDGIQFARRGAPLAIVRRFGGLLLSGGIGIVLGTRVLTLLSPRAATLILGLFVLIFVTLSATDPQSSDQGRSPYQVTAPSCTSL